MDTIQHIEGCKELLKEAVAKIDFQIEFKKLQFTDSKKIYIEIQLRKDRYLIYKSYNVSQILGFIDGIKEAKKIR